jgi:hypothetical protein
MTWTVWANGVYTGAWEGEEVEKTISTAGQALFRIDSPYVDGYHFYFAWDSESKARIVVPIAELVHQDLLSQDAGIESNGGHVFWRTDPDPVYTYYNAASNTFVINSNYSVFVNGTYLGNFGWFDDFFEITE